jgi:uncharacterized protein (DUF58 family)
MSRQPTLATRRRPPGRRLLVVIFLAYALFVLGLATRKGEILWLAIPFILVLSAAYFYAPAVPNLQIRRSFSEDYVSPGKTITVSITIHNLGESLDELFIEDHLPPKLIMIEGENYLATNLPKNGQVEFRYQVQGERGSYPFDKIYIRANDALGLVNRQEWISVPGNIFVKPAIRKLRSIPIRPLNTHLFTGPIPAHRGGPGLNFFEVREYSLGDPLRQINWKTMARHDDELFTNHFEIERVADVGIILDARQQTDTTLPAKSDPTAPQLALSLFEHSVLATAALSDLFLSDGHRVGLLVYGRGQHATFPGYGKIQRERILRSLAQARTGDNMALESLSYLPTRFFPSRSQIVFISPLSPADPPILTQLLANGYRLLIISPDPVGFEANGLPENFDTLYAYRLARIERTLLIRRLQRFGITVIDWQVDQPLEKVLRNVLFRAPQEYRKLGLGI